MAKEKIDNLIYERQLMQSGCKYICGVDEVGRGPLAGNLYVVAVIMPLEACDIIDGVTDSKSISEKKRNLLFTQIENKLIEQVTIEVTPQEIDRVNILQATRNAMKLAVESLQIKPDYVLIDGNMDIDIDIPHRSVVKGDKLCYVIGSASILAKVKRDKYMVEMSHTYPMYHFESNMGYGTREHMQAIDTYGISPIHRKSFCHSAH